MLMPRMGAQLISAKTSTAYRAMFEANFEMAGSRCARASAASTTRLAHPATK